jgi:hypothetical protein
MTQFKFNPFTKKLDYVGPGTSPSGAVLTLSAEGGTATPPSAGDNFDFSGQITNYPLGTQTVTFSIGGAGEMNADAVFPHWQVISTSQTAKKSQGYLVNHSASAITVTLPLSPVVGDSFVVSDIAGGKFIIGQNNGDSIRLGKDLTTTTTGSISSMLNGDTLTLVCWASGPGASWVAIQPIGNFSVA